MSQAVILRTMVSLHHTSARLQSRAGQCKLDPLLQQTKTVFAKHKRAFSALHVMPRKDVPRGPSHQLRSRSTACTPRRISAAGPKAKPMLMSSSHTAIGIDKTANEHKLSTLQAQQHPQVHGSNPATAEQLHLACPPKHGGRRRGPRHTQGCVRP